jgi:HTH-type transcriptional regulator, sugar sensing transcriptional regulator
MHNLISQLSDLGMSVYESKVYLALLAKGPSTAYEASKASGVPTSKVYEVLGKLTGRGSVTLIQGKKTKRYVAQEPAELLNRHRVAFDGTLAELGPKLEQAKSRATATSIWTIEDYGFLLEKAWTMIESARQTVLLSVWREELKALDSAASRAIKRGVKVSVVHFGSAVRIPGQAFIHPIEDTLYQEKGGRCLTLIIDSNEVLTATIYDDVRVEGAWSKNSGFVTIAEDYIKHDIYIMKIVRRFDRNLKQCFGPRYEHLRNIFSDEEEK